MKHTPAPWIKSGNSLITLDETISGNIICDAPEYASDSMGYWEANAKLISAAPELLEALILAYDKAIVSGKLDSKTIGVLINAINKATL